MDNSTFVSLSLATAMRRDMDVTANNIANANTPGFRGERVLFESLIMDEQNGDKGTAFVLDSGSYVDTRQGMLTQTGNPLDIALQGNAWLSYRTDTGQMAYGRDGRLTMDAQGNLVTVSGAQVLDVGGNPVALPPDLEGPVSISADGTISAPGRGTLGRLGLYDLPDEQGLERIGSGLFVAAEGRPAVATPAIDTKVVQGAIEGSNVQPIIEMTRMMAIQKAYDRAVKLMGGEDELRRDALRRLGKQF
ncbi:flagellar basal-body rod protein FlgF [Brevirhabdus pacifica]|uniref:Flagellar basal-body rod protein FlgF n=1 Tax=Brevirhabdus pacifica TaxID=1267768 RepID=A0A1U7DH48_9RHOB|nr:flagellar basal-body rod protein FlgF [Brevirhabdus pacifica]APX89213.1 flagellar basal-body rod protein FlgF [Brevirhabdus pacifica]OWU76740.1 flagellar basal-body rod protein FlgF [Loktanella sp. 22II-4b]PJJ86184.1 flagellar basal-body rod protein FlgF [Brevirhabdus pacifica]